MNTIMECLVRFAGCNRYMAHSKIDDALRQFPRDGQRNWYHSLVQSGPDTFSGVIRTTSKDVATALAQAKWKEIPMPSPGQACTAVIEVAPKKIAQYSAFRRPEFALEFARKRLIDSGAFDDLQVEHLSHSFFAVEKPGNSYSGPTAWFEVRGKARDQQALAQLITQGIGGSHAFGIGLLNLSTSPLYPIAQAVAMARREARPALQFLT